MKKLVKGIVEFRKNTLPEYRQKFGHLALKHSPDTLFIACADSRVVPNVFASTDPGDLFVLRNVGNLVPPCEHQDKHSHDQSEAAAIEFAINTLGIADIVICGHSECGAMQAIWSGREKLTAHNLKNWLCYGEEALTKLKENPDFGRQWSDVNRLSQMNVLLQIEHLKTYPEIQSRLKQGTIKLHGWWFELAHADVYAYELEQNKFVLIDENEAERILQQLSSS